MRLQRNIGALDRAIRIVFGSVLLLVVPLAFLGQVSKWALLGLFGVIPLTAGLLGYCPPYAMIGKNTYRGRARPADGSAHQIIDPAIVADASVQRR